MTSAYDCLSPTIVDTREDLSLLYRVLRLVIKPLRPRLTSPPKKALPRGSPKLSRDAKIKRTSSCDVVERHDEFGLGLWVYDFEPKSRHRRDHCRRRHYSTTTAASPPSSAGHPSSDATPTTTTTTPGTSRAASSPRHRVLFFAGAGFRRPRARCTGALSRAWRTSSPMNTSSHSCRIRSRPRARQASRCRC
ncbi:uncharacterized protein B0I36DRAFT_97273 [Microdochium trichocladiopsis]|uniref:Uncharacterized protein n=1 Tax=Microdochium trichocladiopsis TaxID=1682393 RepID=A0A9P8YCG7_9PEZI|nr:uncharacterized protein B0I36DRAFT_97273 [Microdochium trichocladiopsis]KAH7035841.1 hypothetical protein B0I36DRAFT_97273 [Microdochium trichocladiopsis]